MTGVHFSVDSRLLRELGDRLVGRPHIALAELIKNSYDADATLVVVEFTGDRIIITDNGHGMTRDDFVNRWMRIGSTHKEAEEVSPGLKRPLTGSKGVGRLAVQLLADNLELCSRVATNSTTEIVAVVDWTKAVEAGLLTTATADLRRVKIPAKDKPAPGAPAGVVGEVSSTRDDFPDLAKRASGVQLVLTGLNQTWDRKAFRQLAEEIWPLQPPFRAEGESDFRVVLKSPNEDLVDQFDVQMHAVLELWSARLRGRLLPSDAEVDGTVYDIANPNRTEAADRAAARIVELNVEFVGEDSWTLYYRLPDCHIDRVSFEVRVYNLRNRQPHNISVNDARGYLNAYGGVHVYDAGFHLPYYGPESDWLGIEMDHSHRKTTSAYLPESLTRAGGGEHLPTNSRLYGTVQVSTAHEGIWARKQAAKRLKKTGVESRPAKFVAREGLRIQVTRDRLVDTVAYRNLASIVRAAVDVYAMEQARRNFDAAARDRDTVAPAPEQAQGLAAALERYRSEIPKPMYEELIGRVAETTRAIRAETRARTAQVGLLAPLATAGVSALAYEHEVGKQFLSLEQIAGTLRDGGSDNAAHAAQSIEEWLDRARATRALFTPILNRGNRETRRRLKAKSVVRGVIEQVEGLARGADLTNNVELGLRLPNGTYAEWSALLQNLLINAINATLDSKTRHIDVSSAVEDERVSLRVQDTGYGINLKKAPTLFRPFERDSKVSLDRAELGLGGSGLGLTIVAMIADELGCSVEFEPPSKGFETCANISWEEDE